MNNIVSLRKKTKLSQSQFSKKYDIPLKTLQKWEQGQSNPLPYLMSLIQDEIVEEEYIDVSNYQIRYKDSFKSVIKNKFLNIDRIHPLQQHRVANIIEALKKYEEVLSITIFGSSITHKCNEESDIDIYVELSKDINVKSYDVDVSVDYWTNYNVTPELLDEIKNKGVKVYAR